jgi:hypothetical protein
MLAALATFKPEKIFTINSNLTEEGIFRLSSLPLDILQIWFSLRSRPNGSDIVVWLLLSATVRSPAVFYSVKY